MVDGNCTVWKNNKMMDSFSCRFLHDADFAVFKIVREGTIVFVFRPYQATGWDYSTTGTILKKQTTRVSVKLNTGDEYLFALESSDMTSPGKVIQTLYHAKARELSDNQVLALLKTRDRVPIPDVCALLAKNGLPNTFEDGLSYVENAISTNKVQGTIDGKEFVSTLAMQSQSVRYDIVAKFEMNENGAIVFKCPNCGASLPLTGKESTGECKYCNSTYAIPRKLLDAI